SVHHAGRHDSAHRRLAGGLELGGRGHAADDADRPGQENRHHVDDQRRRRLVDRDRAGARVSLLAQHGAMMRAAAPLGSYWNPADVHAMIALSNANATATRLPASPGVFVGVRGVTSHNAGKWYAECVDDVDVP